MYQHVRKMYSPSRNVMSTWIEKLFPTKNQGCINFGFWKGIKEPLSIRKRIESQKQLYFEVFKKIDPLRKRVLEVGCGRGHGVFWLRKQGYEAFGIDVLSSQIAKSKKHYPHLADCFKIGEAERIPFEDSTFDCIYSLEAVQHFLSFDEFCREAIRVLKDDGKLIISTYFIVSNEFVNDIKKIIPDSLEGFHNALTISDTIQLIQSNGFEVRTSPCSIGDEVFPLYASWQKLQLGKTPTSSLSKERMKWKDYYTGGGNEDHPWYKAFKNGWIDYYIIEAVKKNHV